MQSDVWSRNSEGPRLGTPGLLGSQFTAEVRELRALGENPRGQRQGSPLLALARLLRIQGRAGLRPPRRPHHRGAAVLGDAALTPPHGVLRGSCTGPARSPPQSAAAAVRRVEKRTWMKRKTTRPATAEVAGGLTRGGERPPRFFLCASHLACDGLASTTVPPPRWTQPLSGVTEDAPLAPPIMGNNAARHEFLGEGPGERRESISGVGAFPNCLPPRSCSPPAPPHTRSTAGRALDLGLNLCFSQWGGGGRS